MAGNSHGWRGITVGVLFLTGCLGLRDMPAGKVTPKRPQPAVEPFKPELRISDNADTPAKNDIPIVPVPPLPRRSIDTRNDKPRNDKPRNDKPQNDKPQNDKPPSSPESRRSDPPQPDGSTPMPARTVRQLIDQAVARSATLDSYIVRLTRRENLKGKLGPEEIIAFSFRKKPFSIHLKWLGKEAQGREVIYVKGRFDSKIHTKVAAGDSMLLPAGARLSLSPDNPLVRAASRHPITDAGVCRCVETIAAHLDAQERGDRRHGTLTVLAPQRRPEFPQPVETVERLMPPGAEPELPRGGRRLMYFDPHWHLPMLVITYDDKGSEVEYYRYDRMMTPVNLDDDDFNPDKLWHPPANRQRELPGNRRPLPGNRSQPGS